MPRDTRSDSPLWTIAQTRKDLEQLVNDRIVGDFGSVQLTELLATKTGETTPRNVLTVAVLREEDAPSEPESCWITPKNDFRPCIDRYGDWRFGVYRTVMTVNTLFEALDRLGNSGVWKPTTTDVRVGTMEAAPGRFAPANGAERVPINGILQNNFWNGCHVFTLTDPEKSDWLDLYEDSFQPITMLTDAIFPHIPWALNSVPDFAGDIIIQVPVTSVMVTETLQPEDDSIKISLAWNEEFKPRPVIAAIDQRNDGCYVNAEVTSPFTTHETLTLRSRLGRYTLTIWDQQSKTLLAATAPASIVQAINFAVNVSAQEPRTFLLRNRPDDQEQRVDLTMSSDALNVGPGPASRDRWRAWRLDANAIQADEDRRNFIQYLPGTDPEGEHQRILQHIRALIGKHGSGGVWLWDPYLSARDVLETLFFCPFSGVELRALTRGILPPRNGEETGLETTTPPECTTTLIQNSKEVPDGALTNARETFVRSQRYLLERDHGNKRGLNLEFRISHSRPEPEFHGRFLIFPPLTTPAGRAQAWNLGSSLNSIGKSHDTMQKVSNAQAIATEFDRRWSDLAHDDHLIWSSND